jgi:hypothetical protein
MKFDFTFYALMGHAIQRCREVAASEQLMGYPGSAAEYSGMMDEFLEAVDWLDGLREPAPVPARRRPVRFSSR